MTKTPDFLIQVSVTIDPYKIYVGYLEMFILETVYPRN